MVSQVRGVRGLFLAFLNILLEQIDAKGRLQPMILDALLTTLEHELSYLSRDLY